ncbi:PEP-CTERM sorting domain-containing protein [Oscillatoria laete-virens NRMC-F 0139]|nr:PEP-CTERM sorting domain-containing protein [Oscillatoria laete-virens]MDL5053673.1 PEP-CTERM sorting domain-containing protein [Oscillatoria laete-virens NRMC-F 0139]
MLVAAHTVVSVAQGALITTLTEYTPGLGDVVATDLANSNQITFASISESGYIPTDGGSAITALVDGAADSYVSENFSVQDGTFSVLITFDTSVNVDGYDITQINTFAGNVGHWGTKLQTYDVYYSSVGSAGFFFLVSVDVAAGAVLTNADYLKVSITDSLAAPLAIGVDALRFDIKPNNDGALLNAHYREFDIFGVPTPTPIPEPSTYLMLTLGGALLYRKLRRK